MNTWSHFIYHEEELNDRFLGKLNISEDRFNIEEYLHLEKIFDNCSLINKIYAIIDDIIKGKTFNTRLRHLLMGDFLFSMVSVDLTDKSHIIFKTSRNDYIAKISFRATINFFLGYNYHDYILWHRKLLIGLRINNILEKTCIRHHDGNVWISVIYFKFNLHNLSHFFLNPLGISNLPFVISVIFEHKYSVSSFRNVWPIKRKKRTMLNVIFDEIGIINSSKNSLTLSGALYKLNIQHILNEKQILLNSVNCGNLQEYFQQLHSILSDKRYISKTNDDFFNLESTPKSDHSSIIDIFQKIISFAILERNIFDRPIFLPCFIDNRGRQYFSTLISPTFYKIFRYLYNFSEKKKFKNLETSIFFNKIIKYSYVVNKFNLNTKKSYIAIVLFIEVGKYFNTTTDYIVSTESIIQRGIYNYESRNLCVNFTDKLYLEKIYLNLFNLLNNDDIDINTIIFKDATSSGLQNYGIYLGYKPDKLKYLNIDADDWCDTYKYIIDKFLTDIPYGLDKRKYWKSTIMTIPYNSVWYSCFIKFLELLKEDGIIYNDFDIEKRSIIRNAHRKFYNDLRLNLKSEFYKTNTKIKTKYKYFKWLIVSNHDIKITYKKSRDKYTIPLYVLIEDDKSTETAGDANDMHHMDALLAKYLLSENDILSIHDCFGIRLCELHLIMDKINHYYSTHIGHFTYSIHIII